MTRTSDDRAANLKHRRVAVSRIFIAAVLVIAPTAAGAQQIDTARSTFAVHVSKSGFFKAFADNHDIQAAVARGSIREGATPSVELVIDVARMRVLDPGLSPRDRSDVQERMLGPEVLDAGRFPEIRFESTAVERGAANEITVSGQLTLHGQTRPLTVKVVRQQDRYKGSALIKQTAFGIVPIKVAGGTVRVKDEVAVTFDIVLTTVRN
jgi:polyisoprenoid-binding protein YceI